VTGEAFAVSVEALDSSTCVVRVSGEIDYAVARQFEDKLHEAVRNPGTHAVVVDLSEVTFVGSDALNALVHGFERQPEPQPRVALVSNDRRVTTIFEITRLDTIFPIVPTRDDAIAYVAG
jgi:anti-anti-sigma factor